MVNGIEMDEDDDEIVTDDEELDPRILEMERARKREVDLKRQSGQLEEEEYGGVGLGYSRS